jgi:hypothetical protein
MVRRHAGAAYFFTDRVRIAGSNPRSASNATKGLGLGA